MTGNICCSFMLHGFVALKWDLIPGETMIPPYNLKMHWLMNKSFGLKQNREGTKSEQRGTFICANEWIFLKLYTLITPYIQALKIDIFK